MAFDDAVTPICWVLGIVNQYLAKNKFVFQSKQGRDMSDTAPDRELTVEELRRVATLSGADVSAIDNFLLAASCRTWRKVDFIVGSAMESLNGRFPGIPDIFFAQRVRTLVRSAKLTSQGNVNYMRHCEVRLPAS